MRVGVRHGEVCCGGLGTIGPEVAGEKYDGDEEEVGDEGTEGRVVEDIVSMKYGDEVFKARQGRNERNWGKEGKKYPSLLTAATTTTGGGAGGGRGRGRGMRSMEGRHEVGRMGEFRGGKPLVIG